jgi:triosephosphate isomerase
MWVGWSNRAASFRRAGICPASETAIARARMKSPWIGTSWKMNKTRAEARAYAEALKASSVVASTHARLFIIPPFTAIADVADVLKEAPVRVGAQNMHWADAGAWTGEISPAMIRDVGATLVEIGHSERRMHFGETDETVALKVKAALTHGLLALVCVGDTKEQYKAGQTSAVLARQVRAVFSAVEPRDRDRIVIAYEPVWSIGEGGVPADPAFAGRQHALIKEESLKLFANPIDVVYGGSVNPGNCRELARQEHIDGLFIGRSAWRAEGYLSIVESVMAALKA